MQITLLGPVEAASVDGPVALGGPKPRALLAMLALDAGSPVSAERLIDGLWGDEPPATAAKMVQLYVSQLRKAMAAHGEPDAIETRGRAYQLQLGRERVDAGRFERLLAQGAAREALDLWRGPALADVAGEPFAAPEIRRLDELRASALEVAIDQDLDAGRHRELLPEIEALLAQEPLRERLHAQRMLALYRSGRQAEALEAYRHARATLVEQVGVEPGPELRRLHEAILRQDPSLEPPGQEPPGSPLVGRDEELGRLLELWRRARAGSGASVLVTGPAGIGKTRLVQELAAEVRRDGGAVVHGELGETHRPTLLVVEDARRAPEVRPESPVLAVATAVHGEGETLELPPLGRDDVAALARYHAGARADAEPPVDRLLAESGGVPARVHRAAAAWAQELATRRVGEAAARASAERAGWHLAGDDVAAEVVELQTVRERAEPADPDAPPACPFKGLASFDVEDAGVFFGRERLVADMIARLPGARLMGIVGPSGSGKSSAMRAGLLAALADGVLPGSRHWPQALIRPGAHPLAALERAVAELPELGRSVIAVDQFEETFTACGDAAERAAFADALVACARDPRRRALVLIAVRADFYGHCADFPELSRLLGANHVMVGPMRRHELRRAIELPAHRAGLRADPELVDALIDDVEHAPGALPLLSTTLLELWQQRDGRRLMLAAYESTGGVLGAVARLAEGAYERLDPAARDGARRILLRLAGEGGVRVRVPIADLPGDLHDVVSALAADRLITVGEGEVEVAHEALLREWPRLRAWLDEDADGRRVHRHLTEAARGWEASGRDAGELYRGSRLAAASDWASAHDEDLNRLEREFLVASREASEAESERRRRTNRRLRALLAGVGTLLLLAVAAGAVALSQRGQARDAARIADAQRLGAEALTNERIDQALLLARAGVELDDSTATRSNLLALQVRDPASLGELRGDGWPVYSLALSDDDRLVAFGDERGAVSVYDTATRKRLSAPYTAPEGLVESLAFSPDGSTLAVVAHCGTPLCDGETFVDLIEPRTGERRRRFVLPPLPNRPFYEYALVRFQPNGRDLIVQKNDVAFPDGPPSRLWRLDAARGTVAGPVVLGRHGAWNLETTADRTRAFVTSPGDDATWEIDPRTLRTVRTHPAGGRTGAVSDDGRLFALGSEDGAVRLLDLETGEVRRFRGRHRGGGMHMTFSPDASTLVASDDSGEILVWDVGRGAIRERFPGPSGEVYGLAVSSDGRTLYSTAPDARMRIWDLGGDRRLDPRFDAGRPMLLDDQSPKGIALSPDGRTLAVTQRSGAVNLVDTRTLETRSSLQAQREPALGVDFSPDGRLLAVTGEGAHVTLWDAGTLARVGSLEGLSGLSQEVVFSPDSRLVAAGSRDDDKQRVLVWDVRSRRPTSVEFGIDGSSLAFSHDGRLLAANGFEDPAEVRDVRTGRLVAQLDTGDLGRTVAFSPNGRLLAVGRYGGTVKLFSTRTWKPVGRVLDGHEARVTALEFSGDGRTLATGAVDGTVRLWSVDTQRAIGSSLEIEPEAYVAAGFSRDGSHLFAVPHTGRGVRWDVRPASWNRHACVVAGRDLTEREWRDALPERPFQPVCSRG
ncbi:MAG TPA: BTAD domain-containing putative transcriptional regulator [Solirubrobacteraceae bacterium]|nr:BTAD domain-containing putative transcriptional regulator [Solirubrobacteraceae bacterium]